MIWSCINAEIAVEEIWIDPARMIDPSVVIGAGKNLIRSFRCLSMLVDACRLFQFEFISI